MAKAVIFLQIIGEFPSLQNQCSVLAKITERNRGSELRVELLIWVILILSISSLVSIVALLNLFFANKKLSKLKTQKKYEAYNKTDTILELLFEIFLARKDLENHFLEYAQSGTSNERTSKQASYKTDASRYISFCINRLKQIMDAITDDNCSVSIKLLVENPSEDQVESSSEPHIVTFSRDAQSEHFRGDTDQQIESYPFSKHTPFRELLLKEETSEVFIDNNLKARRKRGEYDNVNPNWNRFYNATAVIPIKDPINKANNDVMGFICIDNWHGRMHEKITTGILKIVSSSVYYALQTVAVLDITFEKEGS